jgi:hypothetical protein
MSTTYPATKQTFTDPNGTSLLTSPDHAGLHTDVNDTLEAIQDTVGTTAGTNVLKSFAAGDFPARINSSNVLQQRVSGTVDNAILGTPALSAGTWSNAQLIGTPQITGGTITNAALIGTSQFTGGSISGQVVNNGTVSGGVYGTAQHTGGTLTGMTMVGTSNTISAIDNTMMTNRTRNIAIPAALWGARSGSPLYETSTDDIVYWGFDAAATEIIMSNSIEVPEDFAGGNITIKSKWYMVSATSGNVVIDAQYSFFTDNELITGITSIGNGTVAVPGTAKIMKTYTHSSAVSGLTAGDLMKFRFLRVGDDVGDTATGDLNLLSIELEYTADM